MLIQLGRYPNFAISFIFISAVKTLCCCVLQVGGLQKHLPSCVDSLSIVRFPTLTVVKLSKRVEQLVLCWPSVTCYDTLLRLVN